MAKRRGVSYEKRQGYIALAGFAAMLVISKMDYHFFAKFTVPAIVVSYIRYVW